MSIEQVSLALNTKGLDPTTKLVLIGLANHAHRDGTSAFPTIETLVEYTGVSRSSVKRHLKILRESKLIEETKAAVRGRATVYNLHLSGVNLTPQGDATATLEGSPATVEGSPMHDTGFTHGAPNRKEPSEPSELPAAPVKDITAEILLAPDSRSAYFMEKLKERDERWSMITPSALMLLGRSFGGATVIEALSYVYEQPDTAIAPYPYLSTICRRISERGVA